MSGTQEQQEAAGDLMRFLRLRPPARVVRDGRNLVVEAAGQVLPERPTAWANLYEVIYRP